MQSATVFYIVTSTHPLSMHTEFFSLSSIFLSINMFWTWTWLMLVTLGCLTYLLKKKSNNNSTHLPPGPKGLPILGNLLMLGKFPHRDLQRLAKQYGSIMHLRLGFVPTIVVSSPRAAELFVKVNDLNFSSRPLTETAKSYSSKGLLFTEYGPFWRNIRKLCTLHLLSSHKIESFKSMRRRELELLVESLKEAARTRVFVDLSTKIWSLSMDMSCLMILGKKYMKNDDDQIKFLSNLQEGMQLAAAPNMADYIPYIGALDLQGLGKRLRVVSKVFDDLFEKIIDEHIIEPDQGQHRGDFVDVMLSLMNSKDSEFQITRANIKAIMLDMLAGSMDTSSTAIEWAFAELLRDPRAMKKVQQEIENVVGMDREVEEADLVKFQYLDMVVKESLRLHPVAPFLIPHESMEDCTVSGYHIPAKSRIMVNAWAIGRDPTVWPEPDKFFPERFIGSNIDLRGRDFELLPFGSGRRGCPGMQLGLTIVRLVVAQLAHCFDWELPNGMLPSELNMEEDFGLTMPRANHLSVTPMYRLTTRPGSEIM